MFSPKPGQRTCRRVLAEPVDVEDARRDRERALHLDPVAEVVAHVIAAEGQHGHGIAAHLPTAPRPRPWSPSPWWRPCRRPRPVEGLIDQRHGGGAASAEDDGADGNALGSSQSGSMQGALRGGRGEAGVGMRRFGSVFLAISGVQRLPCQSRHFGGRLVGHAFPPDAAFGRERDVGEDGVAGKRRHRRWDWSCRRCRARRRRIRLGIDGAQLAVSSGLIQAMSSPTVQTFQPRIPWAESSWRSWFCRRRKGKRRRRRSSRPAGFRRRG
jgi:hypothetical protein